MKTQKKDKKKIELTIQYFGSIVIKNVAIIIQIMNDERENGESVGECNKLDAGKTADKFDYTEIERMLPEQFDDLYKTLPLTEETTCGVWFIRGNLWQK